ncbi:MAG TPA: hypothetical protein VK779_04465 [Rhizomicrobium sp.]|nr:hypothetical protein [Rhizomicrobium sp.]
MLTLPDGQLALARAANSVSLELYARTIVAVRRDHEERYAAAALVERALGPDTEVLILGHDTRGPADTVAEMIRRSAVSGAFAIKDADSFFDAVPSSAPGFVAVCDVRATPQMSNVGGKSFAVVNDNGLIVGMVEKSLASNYVSVGLYGFPDTNIYAETFRVLSDAYESGEIFVSHVVNRAITNGLVVAPLFVSNLVDVGTAEDWRRHVRTRGSIFTDLDGVVFQNHSAYFAPFWSDEDIPIEENVATLRAWQEQGAQLVFITARPDIYRRKTEQALQKLGLNPHALIMNCRHGRRFLINDHAASNPYPAAVGISIERDSPTLSDYLKDWL